jgi:hypothetical protein
MQNQKDHEQITQRVWQIVDALPQRAAIVEGDARHWVAEVVGSYGDLAIWHAIRAGGFGGSQIGALVRNHAGQKADHDQSAHDIVEGALLRRLPDEPSGPMRRGVAMEPQHRTWFYEKYAAKRDVQGFEVLSKNTGPRPWMRYSPDDLVYMPQAEGPALRYLIDFKAPTGVDHGENIAFQYACQLHMGRLVCEHNGVSIDGLMLSQFDWGNWQLKDDEVGYLPQLDDLIVNAGDHYWSYVLRGEVPPYVRRPKLDADAFPEEVRDAALRLARLKALCSVIGKKVDVLEEQVKPILEKFQFGGSSLRLSGITYTAVAKPDAEKIKQVVPAEILERVPLQAGKKRYDEKKMLDKLKELAVDVAQFTQPNCMDNDALYAALCDSGFDADALMKEQLRGTIDKKLTEEADAWVEREFADLIHPQQAADQEVGSPNDRDGQEAQRQVPRSVSA